MARHYRVLEAGQRWKAPAKGALVREFLTVFQDDPRLSDVRGGRPPLKWYKDQVVVGEIGMVTTDYRNQPLPKPAQYPKVNELIRLATESEAGELLPLLEDLKQKQEQEQKQEQPEGGSSPLTALHSGESTAHPASCGRASPTGCGCRGALVPPPSVADLRPGNDGNRQPERYSHQSVVYESDQI